MIGRILANVCVLQCLATALCGVAGTVGVRAVEPTPEEAEYFEKHIRPVLVDKCYKCHSSTSTKLKGGLLLDSREGMLKGGDTGPALVAGNADKSLLITAIRYTDKEMQMPPKEQLPTEQVKAFEQWVKMGAPDPRVSGAVAATQPAFNYEEARKFWSFQPVKDPIPPNDVEAEWAANPVDRFVRAKQKVKGLTPAALADRRTLIRRATFDLTGLPPTPDEVDAFIGDKSADAWAKVVDRLLASTAYGEKWGRHWLDVVRYADTSGCNSDYPITEAYKYRNYVIESFNADKPFDQFLKEQIAGDLLPAKDDAERFQHIIATGYLAIARRFGSRAAEFHLTIEDEIDNLGKGMLGMTIGCARCHDHKFDPIPATDYYGLYGIFNSTKHAFPGTEIFQHPKDFVPLVSGELADQYRAREVEMAAIDNRLERLVQESKPLAREEQDAAKAKAHAMVLPAPKVDAVLASQLALSFSAGVGTPRLALAFPAELTAMTAAANPPRTMAAVRAEQAQLRARQKELNAEPIVVDKAYAVQEGPNPGNAKLQRKGDPRNLGEEVPRGLMAVLGGKTLPATEKGSGRRELAEWVADRDNPLTARVFVNRIWQWHFGKGIVQTPNDFGSRGKVPTHPELLDYLTSRFVQNGWSIKAMHRMILTSRTYQLASEDENPGRAAKSATLDVANDYLWRFNRRRLEAEEVRDSLMAIAGTLDRTEAGPHAFPSESERHYSQHKPFIASYETNHRSVYLMQQRIRKQPYLEVFDGADTNAVTASRAKESSPVQALFFMNDSLAFDSAAKFEERLATACGPDEEKRVEMAYRYCFGRPAESEERFVAHEYVRDLTEKLKEADDLPADQRTKTAWASYLRVLMGSNEFFYVD